jgi:hypothetical protein
MTKLTTEQKAWLDTCKPEMLPGKRAIAACPHAVWLDEGEWSADSLLGVLELMRSRGINPRYCRECLRAWEQERHEEQEQSD